jgi:protein ImuB
VTPVRTLVVWCPDWPLVAAGVPLTEPAMVLHANRVVACSPAARQAGVEVGLRRREAQGRCPHVQVIERDDTTEARRFEPVLSAVEAFTPRLEVTHPGACAVATRGPARYFGGDQALAARIAAAVDEVLAGLDPTARCRVGVADGPFAARLAARHRRARREPLIIPPGDSPPFLAPLPLSALDRPELTDVLGRLGLHTLGDLAALPAGSVVGRFGAEGEAAHRLAQGLDERPPHLTTPPPDLQAATELDPPAERVEPVAFVARTLADDLHQRLDALGLACTRVLVTAESEHGERHERCWRHEGALTVAAMADRVRWQLDGWLHGPERQRPTAGISRLALTPDEVVPATGRQLGFWGGETEAAERAARALARVQGLLGPDAVTVPEWRGGRSPAEAVVQVPAGAVDLVAREDAARDAVGGRVGAPAAGRRPGRGGPTGGAPLDPPWPGSLPAPSPSRVHQPVLPAEVTDGQGRVVRVDGRGFVSSAPARVAVGGGGVATVDAWAGPWPVDERWWDAARRRRRARLQVVTATGTAHLLTIEGGRWWCEATYD